MPRFAVTREHGEAWDDSRTLREQDQWDEHAAFMNALVAEGFIVLGGPIGDGRRVLLIVDAADEEEIAGRLAEDVWTVSGHLRTTAIERWEILLAPG